MMLTPHGLVKLMDFGIAKASTDQRLTMTGTTMGSLYYMSPEQIQGAAHIDSRADLYSVGVSLYELVTGKRPFDGDSQFAIMSAHLEKTPVPPVEVDPSLPQALNDAILMSVAKDPAMRFQTAGAFRAALGTVIPASQAAAAGAPILQTAPRPAAPVITQPPAPVPAPGFQPMAAAPVAMAPAKPKGRRGLWMAMGALAAALGAIAVVEFGPWKNTKAQTPASQAQATQTALPPTTAAQPAPTQSQPAAATSAPPPTEAKVEPPLQQAAPMQTVARVKPSVAKRSAGKYRVRGATTAADASGQLRRPCSNPRSNPCNSRPPSNRWRSRLRLNRRPQPCRDAGHSRAIRTVGCARQRHSYQLAIAAAVAGGKRTQSEFALHRAGFLNG